MKTKLKWYKLSWVETHDGRRATPMYWHRSKVKAMACLAKVGQRYPRYGPMLERTDWEGDSDEGITT